MNPQAHGLLVTEQHRNFMIMIGQYPQLSMEFFGEGFSDPQVKIKELAKSTEQSPP
jgi:hypothetical protein